MKKHVSFFYISAEMKRQYFASFSPALAKADMVQLIPAPGFLQPWTTQFLKRLIQQIV